MHSEIEIADTVGGNPSPDQPGDRARALVSDAPLPDDPLQDASGVAAEPVGLGGRELFIFYPDGQADTRLQLPAMAAGTART